MLKTTLLNGITTEKDKDYTQLGLATVRPGVVSGLEVTLNSISAGFWFIKITRTATTPTEEILVRVEITEAYTIDTSGTNKVWIVIDQNNINDPALNDANGTTAGSIGEGASYPAGNYIPLADIVAGAITDNREATTIKAKGINGAELFFDINAGGTELILRKLDGDEADIKVENINALTDILLNGVGTNLANWLVVLNGSGKIDPSFLNASPVEATTLNFIAWEDLTTWNALYLKSTDGKVYKTDASNNTKINFIWFATATVLSNGTVPVNTTGIDTNQSWLTVWSDYFLWQSLVAETVQQLTSSSYLNVSATTSYWQTITFLTNVVNLLSFKERSFWNWNFTAKLYYSVWWTLLATSDTIVKNWSEAFYTYTFTNAPVSIWQYYIEITTTGTLSYPLWYTGAPYSWWDYYGDRVLKTNQDMYFIVEANNWWGGTWTITISSGQYPVKVWQGIDTTKIKIEENNDNLNGLITTSVTAWGIAPPNITEFITVKINWVDRKLAVYTV